MLSRRNFIKHGAQASLAAATMPLWSHITSQTAFGQTTSSTGYKAIILITLGGGNDGNNTLIPLDSAEYTQYASLRGSVALNRGDCHVLSSGSGNPTFGLHPSLTNVAKYYNNRQSMLVANVGPLFKPVTKAQLQVSQDLLPACFLSHPVGIQQWESATTEAAPSSGWGGRIADLIAGESGQLPPILNASSDSIFTVGRSVQGVVLPSGGGPYPALPTPIQSAILRMAKSDAASNNHIAAQAGQLRIQAMQEQQLLAAAQSAGSTLKTPFQSSPFGNQMRAVAELINGRNITGAKRQLFYLRQGSYDTHTNQISTQGYCLQDLDQGLGSMMQALEEMGLSDQVIICTHSDFGRTLQSNVNLGSDHAWGNHHLILGGGINGGRVAGQMPTLEFGGPSDYGSQGIWIPTTSVTQMTAGIGLWMGLNRAQIASVFPDLTNFAQGAVSLS